MKDFPIYWRVWKHNVPNEKTRYKPECFTGEKLRWNFLLYLPIIIDFLFGICFFLSGKFNENSS